MLKIKRIDLGVMPVTDQRPNIRFALESDQPGEALQRAVLRCGSWSAETVDQLHNPYGGEMQPHTVYTVRLEATGTTGQQAEGAVRFTTGKLDTPWAGQWITDASYTFPDGASPCPMVFSKRFTVEKPVRRAWLHATALGIYELTLNGQKVGQDYFAPGFTSYTHQLQYQTYDITGAMEAENALCATVAGGWAVAAWTEKRVSKITAPQQAFLAEVHIEFSDGSRRVFGTDESWTVSLDGPVRMAQWYDGEEYDAGREGVRLSGKPADVAALPFRPKLIAQYGPPVRAGQALAPVSCVRAPSGEWIYDFGENFAGVIHAELTGHGGQKIVFRHAEVLVEGELFTKPLRTAKAQAVYTCREGRQSYSPRFTYMGFRYVGVRGIEPEELTLTALPLHSDLTPTGTFTCSDDRLNHLEENIRRSGLSNFVDIPTDCPQRDERQGWTGDAAVFAPTACCLFDMSRFYNKWLLDLSAEQGKGGGLPMVVPRQGNGWPVMATSCWGDSCILVPWAEYMARGDKTLLERQYPTMRRFLKAAKWWAGFLSLGPHGRYIWKWPFHFGDWCAPGGDFIQWISRAKWVGTAYFANSCALAAQIAELLEKPEDAKTYRTMREKICQAYRKVLTDGHGRVKEETQTAYVLPLAFGMTRGEETRAMAQRLRELLEENDYKVGTGFPATPYLLFALSDHGHLDAAYQVLLQEQCPGWLYAVKAGATTIWERWDALRPDGTVNLGRGGDENGGMVSFNHYANGAVGAWLYRRLAGIEPLSGGYRTFRVAPRPGGGITFAKATVETPYGTAGVRWERGDGRLRLEVVVPVSTQCELVMPGGETRILHSGTYTFTGADDETN